MVLQCIGLESAQIDYRKILKLFSRNDVITEPAAGVFLEGARASCFEKVEVTLEK